MNAPPPRVSIVLPVLNGERFLLEAVKSVQAQTFTSWELIVVDDASTDGTSTIAETLAQSDKRITVIHNTENRKLPGSLNIGFARARGHYLTWTSHDNRYHPHALETMIGTLERHTDVDVVYAACHTIDADGRRIGHQRIRRPSWLYCHNVVGACFLYRASLQSRLCGYNESLFLMEDWEFWLRAARVARFYRIATYLYDYRYHEHSLTSTRLMDIVETHLRVVDDVLTQTSGVSTRIIAMSRLYMAMGAYRIGKGSEGNAQLRKIRARSRGWYWFILVMFHCYRLKKSIQCITLQH